MAGKHRKSPSLPWALHSVKEKARTRSRLVDDEVIIGPGAAKSWSLDRAVKHSEHGQAMRAALKISKKKAKGVGLDHFSPTKKKKVRKGPISR